MRGRETAGRGRERVRGEDSESERRRIWMLYYRVNCSAGVVSSVAAALASLCIPIKDAFLAFRLMKEN